MLPRGSLPRAPLYFPPLRPDATSSSLRTLCTPLLRRSLQVCLLLTQPYASSSRPSPPRHTTAGSPSHRHAPVAAAPTQYPSLAASNCLRHGIQAPHMTLRRHYIPHSASKHPPSLETTQISPRTAKSFDTPAALSYNLQAITRAWVAKLADALDSGSSEQYVHVGSSPVPRTKVP